MVFFLIGLGLADVKDITVRGLEIVKRCKFVYLDTYTSILCYGIDRMQLEDFYGRPLLDADRDLVEQGSDKMLKSAEFDDVCLLVVGDPFGATTHTDLMLRAKQLGVSVQVVHNSSILTAIGCSGLQLYNFGETVSIVLWTDTWKPESYFDKISANMQRHLHTLCLLDIKTKEQSVENLVKGKPIYEPPRYMSCLEAADQLLQIASSRNSDSTVCSSTTSTSKLSVLSSDTKCVGLARVGWENQKIISCTLGEMCRVDMGEPLHSLIICGKLHPLEEEMLAMFAVHLSS